MIKNITINLGGKDRIFHFGLMFIGNTLESLDLDYNELIQKTAKNITKYVPILMYESLKSSYYMNDEKVDFTQKDVLEWLEEKEMFGINELNTFLHAFLGTTENKTPTDEVSEKGNNTEKKN